ncbi:histidine kinase [Actinoallomurus bryophytorum]|uniref:histidine kinase n=1 Tax=Actinoallomurus bryophytorum TaxID=1490222 RepID=A0A543BSZ8_9ACTN|nr:histidine kinase [Actinoallomurus bryophytorum]TQL87958.1 histidine kinase [Actinoallomurus bryophytorum]
MRSVVRPLVSVSTYRRWTFLLGGTALLVPYLLIYAALASVTDSYRQQPARSVFESVTMLLAFVVISSAVAFVPAVRVLCRTAAETLLGVPLPEETAEGLRSWRSRRRTAVWWLLHIGFGGMTGFTVVVGVPAIIYLLEAPFTGHDLGRRLLGRPLPFEPWLSVTLALAALPAIIYLGAAVGAVFARLAPVLLGPSPADRLARLERQTEQLMERNRLARELHDSVGHALTVTTLQAAAAARLLDTDPDFARRALTAIEETGRTALEDLDHVLGLLREDASARTPQRTLADLDGLFDQTRSAGVGVDADIGRIEEIPPVVSREAYRIVQEGLTNALLHAGKVRVTVRLAVRGSRLELEMTNPAGVAPPGPPRTGGGRGLRGIRERVTILGGRMSAGADDGCWRVSVALPVVPWTGEPAGDRSDGGNDGIQRAGV